MTNAQKIAKEKLGLLREVLAEGPAMTNEAPERVIMVRAMGSQEWHQLPSGHTMSMGYMEAAHYVPKADLQAAQARIAELEAALRYISTYANASAEIDPDEARTEAEAASAFAHIEAKARTALEAKP